jgi:hypothetical protein
MATVTAPPNASTVSTAVPRDEAIHRLLLALAIAVAASLILLLALHGAAYYSLTLEERPLSPLHSQLRSSGTIGLKLGFLSLGMFAILFLYPLRKRWRWLGTLGISRRWLNFHILFGIATPLVVTFHTSFKWHGLAGLAYWTMVVVALSGFVGRYVYAKIPRSLRSVKLTMEELDAETAVLASRLGEQDLFRSDDFFPLLDVPAAHEISGMNLVALLAVMLRKDLARPFQVSRLRRRVLNRTQRIATLGGLLRSHNRQLEEVVACVRGQSRLRATAAFLDRTERIFHLWHVIHRPFSISFLALIVVHIAVAISVGF